MDNEQLEAKIYPQFQAETVSTPGSIDGNRQEMVFPEAFMKQPAVHNRPGKTTLFQQVSSQHLVFSMEVRARQAVKSWTHETSLDLYRASDRTRQTLYLHLMVWNRDIFRVLFSDQPEIRDPLAGLPDSMKMLVSPQQPVSTVFSENEQYYGLDTDSICIHVRKTDGQISASRKDGTPFFSEKRTDFKAADIYDLSFSSLGEDAACFEAFDLMPGEVIYGLGERFDSLTRNGRTVDFHNKDAVGTTSRRTYVNIPFYMSTEGYGLFLNSTAPTDWQIGTTDIGALSLAVWDDQLDYFIIAGRTPKEILRGYCSLTGFSELPPLWSFGLWMSRNSYTSWEIVDEIADQVRRHDIPCDVLHLDTAWFNRDWNCDLRFSEERFPDPQAHLAALRERGFHVSLWQYNFIPPADDNANYQEAAAHGYLAMDAHGHPYHLPEECVGSWVDDAVIDFSNPEARAWYGSKIAGLIRMGAGAIKTDFGEGIPTDAKYAAVDGKYFHNLYSLVYNATVFNASKSVSHENIVWARSGTAGSQRYPLHWGGDSQCSFDGLAGTLRAALTIGMSGIPFFSHDIGGFIGMPDDELYVRWAQLGLFSSHSRCHGAGDHTHREPWYFSDEACEIFRLYDKLRYSLMPYIYAEAEKCTQTGLPMMRALYLEYPEDMNVWYIDDEYLFGDSLLIAPVLKPLSRSRVRRVYLPQGVWFDYWTHERIDSRGEWIERGIDLATMPIYVKQGTELRYCDADKSLIHGMGKIVRVEKWD